MYLIRSLLPSLYLCCVVCLADDLEFKPSTTPQNPTLESSFARTQALLLLDYENDANFNSKIDKYYTAGVRLSFITKESNALRFLRFVSLQQFFKPSALHTSFGLAIKQEMYTPKDRFSPIPPEDDHPYGGYLGVSLRSFVRSAYVFESLGLDIGVVGKASGAKEVQDLIHDLTNNALLAGWGTQLRNELILNAHYGLSASVLKILEHTAHSLDLMPQFSLSLGNARIHSQASLLARFGYRLSPNTAPMYLNSGFMGAPYVGQWFSIYGFVGAGMRVVGRNMFLQGNTFAPHFASNHSIRIKPFVCEFVWGISLRYKRFEIVYSVVHRSREFATQDDFHSFGLISLGGRI